MKIQTCIILICILIAQLSFAKNSHAKNYHRRIPFEMVLKHSESVSVNYDFSEKIGVYCHSDSANIKIKFKYKGHAKSCILPVTLEIDHLPVKGKSHEHLANSSGQFIIINHKIDIPGLSPKASVTIKCKFLSGK